MAQGGASVFADSKLPTDVEQHEYHVLVEAIRQVPVSVMVVGLNGNIQYVNETLCHRTGYRRDELLGRNPRIFASGKTPQKSYQELWTALLSNGEWRGELYNRDKRGNEFVEFAHIVPLRSPSGQISGYLGIKEDITERKKQGQELDRYRQYLQEMIDERIAELLASPKELEATPQVTAAAKANRLKNELTKTPRIGSVRCLSPAGFHRMAYAEWGDPENPNVLVCVHGLTRCGRDFDFLAETLANEYRVVCPDVVGRGTSDWLRDPAYYAVPQYAADMVALLARLDVETIDWLGTSMGGMIGMALAAQPDSPIRRLILNDVGPVIAGAALGRIGDYLASPPDFASLAEAEAYIRTVAAPFGDLTTEQWRHLTVNVVKSGPAGRFSLRYDPNIAQAFKAAVNAQGEGKDIELWPLYDAIRCPTLVIRGENSDLLSREVVMAMSARGPRARATEVPGVGHAPMFLDAAQVELVRGFISATSRV